MSSPGGSRYDLEPLEKDEFAILFFRAAFALGVAVEKHIPALVRARKSKKPLTEFLIERSRDWLDGEIDRLRGQDHSTQIDIIVENILAKKKGVPAALLLVYESIARSVEKLNAADLKGRFQEFSRQVHKSAGGAISTQGGVLAQARWGQCAQADVAFVYPESGLTRCTFTNGIPEWINIHIGNEVNVTPETSRCALRTYFNLHFYFFHEYLSHSFSVWQAPVFVEGYLFWAERKLHFLQTGDNVRKYFVDQTFEARASSDFQAAERVAEWFQVVTGDRFLRFLLEWAAKGEPTDELLLSALNQLSELFNGVSGSLEGVKQAFQDEDPNSTLQKLLKLAQAASGIPKYTFRLQ